jgi:hypothetical protein
MRKNPRRILSPQRLPFRHPGTGIYKLNEDQGLLQRRPKEARKTQRFWSKCDDRRSPYIG